MQCQVQYAFVWKGAACTFSKEKKKVIWFETTPDSKQIFHFELNSPFKKLH